MQCWCFYCLSTTVVCEYERKVSDSTEESQVVVVSKARDKQKTMKCKSKNATFTHGVWFVPSAV